MADAKAKSQKVVGLSSGSDKVFNLKVSIEEFSNQYYQEHFTGVTCGRCT